MALFISKFLAKSKTPNQRFPFEELLTRVDRNWDARRAGYRDGVILVPIDPDGFQCTIAMLQPGDKLCGEFKVRAAGEDPRKRIYLDQRGIEVTPGSFLYQSRKLPPAVAVDVVLYRKDVLEGDKDWKNLTEPTMPISNGMDWYDFAVIAVLARPCKDPLPIDPDTLIANHFHLSGGTATNMTDREFVEALRESVLAWKNLAYVE